MVEDPNTATSQIAANLIESAVTKTFRAAKNASARELDKIQVDLKLGFKKYIKRNIESNSKVKTLIESTTPIDIEAAFVSPELAIRNTEKRFPNIDTSATADEFLDIISPHGKYIITAIAGAGKSMFMKYIYFREATVNKRYIPILVELRHLNELSTPNLFTYIYAQISSINDKFTPEQLDHGLRTGAFMILFDAFDEIRGGLRYDVSRQILDFSYKYDECPIVVSSRPDEQFVSWNEFTEYRILPFSTEKAIELITKINFEEKTKAKFIDLIKKDIHKTHKEFLSNPLLASMMLLTFESAYDIPKKEHVFYQRAFVALIEKHDAAKGYKRQLETGLTQDVIEDVFSAFCIYSYLNVKLSFDEQEVRQNAEFAFKLLSMQGEGQSLFKDLVKSFCLLVRDGDEYSFIHRSFQEYFAALYIARKDPAGANLIVDKLLDEHEFPRRALEFLPQINVELFERHIILPRLEKFLKRIKELEDSGHNAPVLPLITFESPKYTDTKNNDLSDETHWIMGGDSNYNTEYFNFLALIEKYLEINTNADRIYTLMRYGGDYYTDDPAKKEQKDLNNPDYADISDEIKGTIKRFRDRLRRKYARAASVFDELLS